MTDKMFDEAFAAFAAHLATPNDGSAAWAATRDTLNAVVRGHAERLARAEARAKAPRRTPEQVVRARFRARTARGLRP